MSGFVIAIIILFGAFLLTFIFAVCLHNQNKELKGKLERKTNAYNGLYKEFELYRQSELFKHKKEEETDEKINDLHNGTMSADDILPKR